MYRKLAATFSPGCVILNRLLRGWGWKWVVLLHLNVHLVRYSAESARCCEGRRELARWYVAACAALSQENSNQVEKTEGTARVVMRAGSVAPVQLRLDDAVRQVILRPRARWPATTNRSVSFIIFALASIYTTYSIGPIISSRRWIISTAALKYSTYFPVWLRATATMHMLCRWGLFFIYGSQKL